MYKTNVALHDVYSVSGDFRRTRDIVWSKKQPETDTHYKNFRFICEDRWDNKTQKVLLAKNVCQILTKAFYIGFIVFH